MYKSKKMCTWRIFFATNIIFHFPKDQHLKKIQQIEELLNITRDNIKEESKKHFTALWLVGNSTKMDLRSIRVVLNVTRGNIVRQLKEMQNNLTEQVHFLCYFKTEWTSHWTLHVSVITHSITLKLLIQKTLSS